MKKVRNFFGADKTQSAKLPSTTVTGPCTLPFSSSTLGLKLQVHLASMSLLCGKCLLFFQNLVNRFLLPDNIWPWASNLTCIRCITVNECLPFFGIVRFTRKPCEIGVSVKHYTLQMRTLIWSISFSCPHSHD